jgi:outer membrane protein TolC
MKKNFILVLLIVSNISFSQNLMSYKDCLDLALKNNLDIKNALNNEQIAKYQYRASYGNLLPTVFGSMNNKNSWGREIDPKTNVFVDSDIKNFVGYINTSFNLFSGFSALNSIQLAKEDSKISKSAIKKIENEVTISLAEKFITILYLQEMIIANQNQIKSSEKQLELTLLKFDAGTISESEVFKMKTQKATEEMTLLTNQNFLTDNFIALKQLMNIPLETEITLIKPILSLDKNVALEEDPYSIIKRAIAIHPTYEMSLMKEKRAKTVVALARAPLYPSVSLLYQYGSNYTNTDVIPFTNAIVPFNEQYNNNKVNIFRVSVVVPIFSKYENYTKIKTNKLLVKQSKTNTEIVINQLSKEVLKSITDAKTSLKKNEVSAIAFDFAQKSYAVDVLKFELGKINISELNLTKYNFNNSQAKLIQSKYELLYNNALIKFYLGEEFSL